MKKSKRFKTQKDTLKAFYHIDKIAGWPTKFHKFYDNNLGFEAGESSAYADLKRFV